MDDLLHWLWVLVLIIFHWFLSRGWMWLVLGVIFAYFQWVLKSTIRDGVEEAMKRTVVPALDEISEKLNKEDDEY